MADNRINFDFPSNTKFFDDTGAINAPWMLWFSRIHSIVVTGQQAGTTAKRPTDQLWIGRQYFDVTLNKPIYVSAVKPTVWRDSSGAVV
jgi:hypothetical protein